jgi:hypothetical protein
VRLHRLAEAIARGEVCLAGAEEQIEQGDPRAATLFSSMDAAMVLAADAPTFYFGRRYYEIGGCAALFETAKEFARAGLLRLPFPAVVFEAEPDEIEDGLLSWFVLGCEPRALAGPADRARVLPDLVFQLFGLYSDGVGFVGGYSIALFGDKVRIDDNHRDIRRDVAALVLPKYAAKFALAALVAIGSKGVKSELVAAPERLNRQRAKKGRRPLGAYRKVILGDVVARNGGTSGEGGHASPRLHWRRGHVRTLASGRQVPVVPHLVGSSELGIVRKDYEFRRTLP